MLTDNQAKSYTVQRLLDPRMSTETKQGEWYYLRRTMGIELYNMLMTELTHPCVVRIEEITEERVVNYVPMERIAIIAHCTPVEYEHIHYFDHGPLRFTAEPRDKIINDIVLRRKLRILKTRLTSLWDTCCGKVVYVQE